MSQQLPYPLRKYWPKEVDTTQASSTWHNDTRCHIGALGKDNEFQLEVGGETLWLPAAYKNGLRLMNAKISFLRSLLMVLSEPIPPNVSVQGKEQARIAQDSVIRNLIFSTKVRTEFLSKLRYQRRTRAAFRCIVMDTWLFCERHWGIHDPWNVKTFLHKSTWKLPENGKKNCVIEVQCI
jgi:hypothetical protein